MIRVVDVDIWAEDHYGHQYVRRESTCASIEAVEITTDLGLDGKYYEIAVARDEVITVTVFDSDNEVLSKGEIMFALVASLTETP